MLLCCQSSIPTKSKFQLNLSKRVHTCVSIPPLAPSELAYTRSLHAEVFVPVSGCKAPPDLLPRFVPSNSLFPSVPSWSLHLFGRVSYAGGAAVSPRHRLRFNPLNLHITRTSLARPFMSHVDPVSYVRMSVGVVSGISLAPARWLPVMMLSRRSKIIGWIRRRFAGGTLSLSW